MKILLKILKNGLTHGIMMKEEEKNHCLQQRNKKVIGLMKYEKKRKLITKFATTAPKTYGPRVQQDYQEKGGSEFIKVKRVKKSTSKELIFHDFD